MNTTSQKKKYFGTKTARKELRKSKKRNYFNTLKKQNAKKLRKKLITRTEKNHQVTDTDVEKQKQNKDFSNYMSIIAKMKKTHLIHYKKASRMVSRMYKKIKETL